MRKRRPFSLCDLMMGARVLAFCCPELVVQLRLLIYFWRSACDQTDGCQTSARQPLSRIQRLSSPADPEPHWLVLPVICVLHGMTKSRLH